MKKSLLPVYLLIIFASCTHKKTELLWTANFSKIGSQSSPRAVDLNQDGILDLVIGAGLNEYQEAEQGILALNGTNGELLWQHESTDQIYGSAIFSDINNDQIPDVFIGGRSNQFYAINGKTGENLWKWTYTFEENPILKYAKYNFQNAVFLPDQNDDGFSDLLIPCGGNPKAAPGDSSDRFPGVLMIISSKDGKVIAADTMPDGRESYMPPIYFKQPNGDEKIVFGSGGETISGNLYLANLSDLKNQNLKHAQVMASEIGHGFIAPSVAVDINNDDFFDIVAISHASSVFAINGKDNELIWTKKIPETESSNGFSVGQFTGDNTPDFFTFVSKGIWPESTGSVQVLLNGKTGEIAYSNTLGCSGFSSPSIYDLNHDGTDEAVISINEYDCSRGFASGDELDITNKLIAIDFKNKQVQTIDTQKRFKNIFSTPYLGDIDGDSYLDIVYCQYFSPYANLLAFLGMEMKRISTNIKIVKPIKWGTYMGSETNGVYIK